MKAHTPRKRFGQNFLQDPQIIQDIIHAVAPKKADHVVEIGPGLGALTWALLPRLDKLFVVELDRDLIEKLTLHTKIHRLEDRLEIFSCDALKFDFASLPAPLKIVGNLPYNISTPLLFHLASYKNRIADMTFMLQKELVDRMCAAANSSDYGRLSVMLQYDFDIEKVLDVPPESFFPAPKVDSAVVRLVPHAQREVEAQDFDLFNKIVTDAFAQRRKTLRNTLKNWLSDHDFAALEINPQARAETLTLAQFVHIANFCSAKN